MKLLKIKVTVKEVYGNKLIYPACETSQVFAKMLGQKILTSKNIIHIKELGFIVEVVQPTIEL